MTRPRGLGLVACLLAGCGDAEACRTETDLWAQIRDEAENTDKISSAEICAASSDEIVQRLERSTAWRGAGAEAQHERAQQYVTNCAKYRDAQADCND